MASIHRKKMRSGRVVWELTHGRGRERIRLVAGDTREAAEGVLATFRRQLALQGTAPAPTTVAAALSEYKEYLRIHRRPSTARRYWRVMRTFTVFLGEFHPVINRLRDIKVSHLEAYKQRRFAGEVRESDSAGDRRRDERLREELIEAPMSGSPQANARYGWLGRKRLHPQVTERTINYELQCLHTFFRWAIKRNHLFSNPASEVERFRLIKKSLPKFLTSDDLQKFFRACTEKERRVFATMLLTGMRRGEVEYLMWPDISFELGMIFIQAKPEDGWKPKTDERIIPISPTLQQVLFEQFASRGTGRWVFPNRKGNRETHLLEKLKKVCRRAGLRPTTLHALRHSFGAHLRMSGASLADIADLMGHKDLATTAIYAKAQQEHLRSVITKISPLVPPVGGDASLKRVTQPTDRTLSDEKVLTASRLEAPQEEVAGRQGRVPQLGDERGLTSPHSGARVG